jgi:hypothetical protein
VCGDKGLRGMWGLRASIIGPFSSAPNTRASGGPLSTLNARDVIKGAGVHSRIGQKRLRSRSSLACVAREQSTQYTNTLASRDLLLVAVQKKNQFFQQSFFLPCRFLNNCPLNVITLIKKKTAKEFICG